MIGLDTNILVRIFAADEPAQRDAALRLIEALPAGQRAVVNTVVVVELLWVLGRAYGFDRDAQVRVVRALTEHKRLFLPDKDLLREAIHRAREWAADVPDQIITLLNVQHGAATTYTFDRNAARLSGFTLLE